MPKFIKNTYETFRKEIQVTRKVMKPTVNVFDHRDGQVKIMQVGPELHKKLVEAADKILEGQDIEGVGVLPGDHIEKIKTACKKFGLDSYPTMTYKWTRVREYEELPRYRPTRGSVVKESEDVIEIRF